VRAAVRLLAAPPLYADVPPFLAVLDALKMPVCVVSDVDRADFMAAIAPHGLLLTRAVTTGRSG